MTVVTVACWPGASLTVIIHELTHGVRVERAFNIFEWDDARGRQDNVDQAAYRAARMAGYDGIEQDIADMGSGRFLACRY